MSGSSWVAVLCVSCFGTPSGGILFSGQWLSHEQLTPALIHAKRHDLACEHVSVLTLVPEMEEQDREYGAEPMSIAQALNTPANESSGADRMRRRHIALFPLLGKAHIFPYLALCPEFVRRGYHVSLVTDESFARLVAPAGAEPVIFDTCKSSWLDRMRGSAVDGWSANDPRWWEIIGGVFYPMILNNAVLSVWQLEKFYEENRPDLIIYDFGSYAGRILAKRLNAPAIQYYYDFIYQSKRYCWEEGVGYNAESMERFFKLLDASLYAYGFEEGGNFWHSEELNLCPFPKMFQFDADVIDGDRFCFVGPLIDRPFKPMWENRSGGKPIVLVSAISGSVDATYFNTIIEALSRSPYHVILSVGENFPVSELQAIPKNFEINRYASHLEILPHCDLHLYSAGVGGTLEAFYFGVPLIAVPSYINNYQIANKLAERGLALNLPLQSMTSEMIRESVDKALQDEALLDRVKQMQRAVRSSEGSVTAVDKIEAFLAERA